MTNPARSLASPAAAPRPRLERPASDEALARLRHLLDDRHVRRKDKPESFAEFEKSLHAKLMDVEREILAEEMARADVDADAIVVDGVTYRRVVRCFETYFTAAGPVRIERTLYKDRTDEAGRSISPMDLRLGIVEGRWTPVAAEQAAWVVSQMTPVSAAELFNRVGNMTPSKTSLDRLPKALSARWEADRVHFEQALRVEEPTFDRSGCAHVRNRLRGGSGRQPSDWRTVHAREARSAAHDGSCHRRSRTGGRRWIRIADVRLDLRDRAGHRPAWCTSATAWSWRTMALP